MAAIHGMAGEIYVSSSEFSMTDEATTDVGGAHTTYQVTTTSKRILDPNVAVTVKSDAVAITDTALYDINYPEGKIIFHVARGGAEVITVSADYVTGAPQLTQIYGWTLNLDLAVADCTSTDSSGWREYVAGLKGWTVEVNKWWNEGSLFGPLDMDGGPIYRMGTNKLYYVKLVPNSGDTAFYHGWAMLPAIVTNCPADTLVDETITVQGLGYIAYST